jgi:hypothetical protein
MPLLSRSGRFVRTRFTTSVALTLLQFRRGVGVAPLRLGRTAGIAAVATLVALLHTGPGLASTQVTLQNGDPSIHYGDWATVTDPTAHLGHYRESPSKGDTASFHFTGTDVEWMTHKGPDQGLAAITIDAVSKGVFDEYAGSPNADSHDFSGLAATTHTILVKVLGTKDASSTATNIVVNGFLLPATSTIVPDTSPKVVYNTWKTSKNTSASGGSYQSTAKKGATVSLSFSGTAVDWVTATGPAFGVANVTVDGVAQGSVDLYSASQAWQVSENYSGLASGAHTVILTATGAHDASSTGSTIVLDAFVVTQPPVLESITVTPTNPSIQQDGSKQFTATGAYSDGSTQDLTTQVTWSSSDVSIATISNATGSQGLGNATDNTGSVTVSATDGSVAGQTTLTVTCRYHSNGLGQFYQDCSPLGTYNSTTATEAAQVWDASGMIFAAQCGSGSNVANVIVDAQSPTGPWAVWTYSATGTLAATVGHVDETLSGGPFCPQSTDPAWN